MLCVTLTSPVTSAVAGDGGPERPPACRITHGPWDCYFENIVGKPVGSVQRSLATVFSIPDDAEAFIGGFVVDTPGIRQFQLWDIVPEEVAGYYRDIRPYASLCRFPYCTHTHEADGAVKDAVADNRLDARRYESYCHLRGGVME